MIRILFGLLLLFIFQTVTAQRSLFFPRNLKPAYEKGTRSMDGKPGPNYWQNRASYRINASLEPKTRLLSGEETVTYFNNSPDTLKIIRFKLAHDRYRKGASRMGDVTPSDVSDEGVVIHSLTYNSQAVAENNRRKVNTFLDVRLGATPLLPKTTATLTVKWSYVLPAGEDAARECVCDSSTFFVPYWYPQIAVYDDLGGWANAPYTGLQEFYHEFADYDVTFTLPEGYMVWASGELQNAADLFTAPVLDKWNKAHSSAEVISIWTESDLKKGGVFKPAVQQVFHFKSTDVPDFAFAAGDHYNWDASSVVVDDKTGRRSFVSAAYHTDSKDYYKVARIAADGIRLMSTWQPGYPYPYPSMTVFNGNDGMEYPMMCNDASTGDRDPTSLTVHEISHTYFPFMMGINEQDYAWMDEGWASFFDYVLTDSLSGRKSGSVRGYGNIAGTDNDVPPMVRSRNLTTAYRNASYQRPQAAYLMLLDQLGYETFHTCMTEYMNRWKGKHPAPFDFFNTWNQVSGQNLDWFWKPWFFDWGYPDLGIQGVLRDEAANCPVVVVERNGNQPVPIHLELEYSDGAKQTFHQSADIWRDGKTSVRINCAAGKKLNSVLLGNKIIPDTDRKNNEWKN